MRLERGRALVAAGRTSSTSAASRRAATGPRSRPARRSRASSRSWALWPRDGVLVSVDTYKVEVAEAAIAAGAAIVNDVSGLRDPALAVVVRTDRRGAGADAHGGGAQGHAARSRDLRRTSSPTSSRSCASGSRSRVSAGVGEEQLILDPGPDFAKTPAQTVAILRRLDALRGFGRPILLAASRKDFVGAITGRAPASAIRGRWRRSASGSTRAPRSCASTTSRAPPTSSPCAPSARRARRWRRWKASTPERHPGRDPPCRPTASCTGHHDLSRVRARLTLDRRPLNPTRPGAHRFISRRHSCPQFWTAPPWSKARSPTCTCSPTSSGSTASAACASPTSSTPSSPASPAKWSSRPSPRSRRRSRLRPRPSPSARRASDDDDGPKRSRRGRRGGRGRRREEEEGGDAAARRSRRAGRRRRPTPAPRGGGDDERTVEGSVELLANGSGFLRLAAEPTDDDVYISAAQVKRCELVSGDKVAGPMRPARRSERYAVADPRRDDQRPSGRGGRRGHALRGPAGRLAVRAHPARLRRPDRDRDRVADPVRQGLARRHRRPVALGQERGAAAARRRARRALGARGQRRADRRPPGGDRGLPGHAGLGALVLGVRRRAGAGRRAGGRGRPPGRRARRRRGRADRLARVPGGLGGAPCAGRGPQPGRRRLADRDRDLAAARRRRDDRRHARSRRGRRGQLPGARAGRVRHAAPRAARGPGRHRRDPRRRGRLGARAGRRPGAARRCGGTRCRAVRR